MVKRRRKSNGSLMWVAIGLVVVVVLAIVLVTTLSSNGPQQTYFGPTSPTILHEVQGVPASVFDSVGVNSPAILASPLQNIASLQSLGLTANLAPLTFTVDHKKLPGVLYVGAEYCPYCAATRWGIIVALSRFGHFNTLYNMESSANDVYASTTGFSFVGKKPTDVVTYTSKYLVFQPYETLDRNSKTFMALPIPDQRLVNTYDLSSQGPGGIPFMDIGNRYFITGSEFDPSTLANTSRSTIASGLTDPSIPVTQVIIATANYVTAGICAATKSQPTSVCHSSGVLAAAKVMQIKL